LTEGAAMTLFKTLLDKNATAGALLLDPGSIMLFDTSAVTGTLIGGATVDGPGKGVFGDGIVAAAGGELEVASVLVARNARNGIFFSHASGTVANSTIVGNDFYGLAMEECADQVEWEGKGNYVVGNASALPPDKAVQVTTSTGGMAVPPAPEMIEIQTE